MQDNPFNLTRLIHQNCAIVGTFVYSRPKISETISGQFSGEWKYLHKIFFEIAEINADRALLELATHMRLLDDFENISERDRLAGIGLKFGIVQKVSGVEDLYFRDMTNKIIHAAKFQWECSDLNNPKVIAVGRDEKRWRHAEISVVALLAFCGVLVG